MLRLKRCSRACDQILRHYQQEIDVVIKTGEIVINCSCQNASSEDLVRILCIGNQGPETPKWTRLLQEWMLQ